MGQALHEGEEGYRLAAEAASFGAYSIDLRTGITSWSSELKQLFDLPADASITMEAIRERIHPSDRLRFDQFTATLFDALARENYQAEYRIVRADGSIHWLRDRGKILFTGTGFLRQPSHVLGVFTDITEHKQIELALRQSRSAALNLLQDALDTRRQAEKAEEQFRFQASILGQIRDAVVACDEQRRVTYLNSAAERRYGVRSADVMGRPLDELYSCRWPRPEEEKAAQQALEEQGRWRGENIHVTRSGRQLYVESTIENLRDEQGASVGLLAIYRDITESKWAGLHTQFLERLYPDLMQMRAPGELIRHTLQALVVYLGADDASVGEFTPDGLALTIHEEFRQSPGSILGTHRAADFLTDESWEAFRAGTDFAIADVATDPRTRAQADRFRRLDVAAFVTETVVTAEGPRAIITVTSRLPRVWRADEVQFLRDVAARLFPAIERARAEENLKQLNETLEKQVAERTAQLHRQSEQMRAIFDAAFTAILTANYRGVIQSVNQAATRLFGYTEKEMLGQNLTLLMPSPYREHHDDFLEYYQKMGIRRIIGTTRELTARRKDGSVFPVLLAISEIPTLKLYTGFLLDISRQKELEREVVEIASLEQRRIGQDLHDTVGQELTVLNMLIADLPETMRSDPETAAQIVSRMAQALRRSHRELRSVMRGLLPVAIDNEGLMASLSDLANRTQEGGQVGCTFACSRPVWVADHVTATHLYLIAQEAVHNAVKHARAQQIQIGLELQEALILWVQDDGLGMPNQLLETPGLGLRIMHNRAAIIGANLTIEAVEPTGTRITCAVAMRMNHERKR